MTGRDPAPNYRLDRLMAEAGFTSHKSFARAVRSVSEESDVGRPIGCDHTSVSRWLRGMSPRTDAAQYIAIALSRALGRPVTVAEAGLSSSVAVPPDLGLDFLPVAAETVDVVTRLWRADLAEAVAMMGGRADVAAWHRAPLNWLVAAPAAEAPRYRAGVRVGSPDVVRLRATTGLFAELDNRFGGGHARHALIQYLTDDVEPLLRGRYSDSAGRELFSAAAEATLLAAWMSYDTGRHSLAQRYFIQALGLAQAGGDRLLPGTILDAMSHQATFLGRFREAANLARAARMGTQAMATATLTAHFHAMEARALARTGDARSCELALSEAVRAFERRNPDMDPAWIRYFDDAELAAEFGHCLRDLGHAVLATQYAAQSMGSSCGTRSDFFATMVLADAHLRAGDIEQACNVALDALQLGEQLKSARCAGYLREFQADMRQAGSTRAVRDFTEQARASALWQQAAAGAMPE
jgi:tetratricopeptide (TPR) repeat protein